MDPCGIGHQDFLAGQAGSDFDLVAVDLAQGDDLFAGDAVADDEDLAHFAGSIARPRAAQERLAAAAAISSSAVANRPGRRLAVGIRRDGLDHHRPRIVRHHRGDESHPGLEDAIGKAVDVEPHGLARLNPADVLLRNRQRQPQRVDPHQRDDLRGLHPGGNLLADGHEFLGHPAVERGANRRVVHRLCENRQLDLGGPAHLKRLFDLEQRLAVALRGQLVFGLRLIERLGRR